MPTRPLTLLLSLTLLSLPLLGCSTSGRAPGAPPPLVIAHRGASGYLPEHTLPAYAMAIALGADYVEPDVVLSRDGVPICSHDLTMHYTNVSERFPGRRRADGNYYWIDFDLDEIKKLERTGPTPSGIDRLRGYEVATLDELIDLVQTLNRSLNIEIGIIPEPKDPGFHLSESRPIEPILLGALRGRGYAGPSDPCIIQCFDLDSLERMADLTAVAPSDDPDPFMALEGPRMVWLVGNTPTSQELDRAAKFCVGLGPNRELLEDSAGKPRPFLTQAKSLGLELYPYTFGANPVIIERFYNKHGVDGLFTDYPDVAARARDLAR